MLLHLAKIALAIQLMGEAPDLSLDPEEVACMAENIYHEARGESMVGQRAVAHVTLNRVGHEDYPTKICDVVHQKRQFSWTSDSHADIEDDLAYKTAQMVALLAMIGKSEDPTDGATHYFAHRQVTPRWSKQMQTTAIIGGHTFKRNG